MGQLSPVKRTGWGILFGLFSLITTVAIIDYDPSNYHNFPPDGNSPLLGQVGIIIGRYAFAYFGLSSWLLPWFFGVLFVDVPYSYEKKEKIQKLVPLPFIIVSVSFVYGNIKDYDSLKRTTCRYWINHVLSIWCGGFNGSYGYIQECHYLEKLRI